MLPDGPISPPAGTVVPGETLAPLPSFTIWSVVREATAATRKLPAWPSVPAPAMAIVAPGTAHRNPVWPPLGEVPAEI
jgi:hypothetical protein